LFVQTAAAAGLDEALGAALRPWQGARARHDPGRVLLDLAVAVALGGDCLADLAVVRAQPDLFGQVASDPTVTAHRRARRRCTRRPGRRAEGPAQARERV